MTDYFDVTLRALKKLYAESSPDAEFTTGKIFSHADEEVNGNRRGRLMTKLAELGYVAPVGFAKAYGKSRKSSRTTLYRFGRLLRTDEIKSIEQLSNSFFQDCQGIISVSPNQCLRFCVSLLSKRFLILTGLAGSGKTKLAQAFARWITPRESYLGTLNPGDQIQSDRVTYYVKAADSLAVEFWNKETEAEATKVVLPRALINEWVDFIQNNGLPQSTPAREIRDAVQKDSRFSPYLHRFDTHLKAAAFLVLKKQTTSSSVRAYEIVPVGADWMGNESILGYPDGLRPPHDDKVGAYVLKPALDLILRAQANPLVPHFLILDEMNMSHVERYFADLLSAMESHETLTLYSDEIDADGRIKNTRGIEPVITLPENLFIIGTVNVDETTYMFSPKVLDRANVIEFRISAEEMKLFLSERPSFPDLERLDGRGVHFSRAFTQNARQTDPDGTIGVPDEVKVRFENEMFLLFGILQFHGSEFGYRVAYEATRFLYFTKLLNSRVAESSQHVSTDGAGSANEAQRAWFDEAFDAIIVQKILPKLHGSKIKLGGLLQKLYAFCIRPSNALSSSISQADDSTVPGIMDPGKEIPPQARYPISAEKIFRMWKHVNENGFTSFPEN